MTPWRWHAGQVNEFVYDLACDEPSRDSAIRAAVTELFIGDQFQIIEARSSEAKIHEDDDCIPFLRKRNKEIITVTSSLKGGDV